MEEIRLGLITSHFINDHKARMNFIEKSVGVGNPVYTAPDRKGRDCYNILTDTGVMVVKAFDGTVITMWIASVRQADNIYKSATGDKKFSKSNPDLFWRIQYNNNTQVWQTKVAA